MRASKSPTGTPLPSPNDFVPPSEVRTTRGMIDEVDGDVERRAAMMEAACRQAADVHVQRDVPPVVARRRRRQADLPEDLAVQMQCVFSCTPVGQMQLRQGHGLVPTNATSSG